MATLEQLETALVNANKAGDTDAVRRLAVVVKAERQARDDFNTDKATGTKLPAIPGMYDNAQVAGTTPQAPPTTVGQDIVGAGETGLSAITGATTGTVGMIGGFLKGLAQDVLSGKYGTQEGADMVAKSAEEGAGMFTYQPRTQAGQQQTEKLGEVMQHVAPLIPATAELGVVGEAMSAAKPVVRATAREAATPVVTAATDLANQVKAKIAGAPVDPATGAPTVTAGTGQSAGAAAVDMATQRQAAADSLPVPIKLTEGQKTRDFSQQRFERETAKIPDTGEPIRQRMQDQNLKLQQNMDAFIDDTGAELTDARGVGEVVDKALRSRATRDKTKIRALYKEAEKSGETAEPVDLSPVEQLIKESESAKKLAPILGATEDELNRLRGLRETESQSNLPLTATEKNTLREYQNGVEVNEHLRNASDKSALNFTKSLALQKIESSKSQIANLDSAISKSKTPHDMILYRGINKLTKIPDDGEIFIDNGFISTTDNPKIASGFGDVVEVKVPRGSNALNMNESLGKSTRYKDQNEFLLPRGSRFKVSTSPDGRKVLELIPDKPIDLSTASILKSENKATGQLTLADSEQLRKFVNKVAGADPTNIKYAADIKKAIDTATEGKGGELYKQARAARAQYAQDYENFGLAKQLLNTKRGSTDRAIAMEDVLHKSIVSPSASVDTVSKLRHLLETEGEVGQQAWKELQGGMLRHIRDEALKGVTRDSAGNQIVSAAALDRIVTQLDKTGKLDYVLGKKKAEQVRTINDVAKDVLTAPPGAVNTSNTATVLAGLLDLGLASTTGIPAPVAIMTQQAISRIKNAKLRARVKQSLGE